jgi:hypothetical protein
MQTWMSKLQSLLTKIKRCRFGFLKCRDRYTWLKWRDADTEIWVWHKCRLAWLKCREGKIDDNWLKGRDTDMNEWTANIKLWIKCKDALLKCRDADMDD